MISAGMGKEAALAGAFLGDPVLLEKAWEDTAMFPEATLHAQVSSSLSVKTTFAIENLSLAKLVS